MNVLYIANIRLPTEKAHGLQIMKMCGALAAIGCNVTLVVPNRKNHIAQNPFVYYSVPPTFTLHRVPTLDLVKWGTFGFVIQRGSFFFHAARYARSAHADLVYSREAEAARLAQAIKAPFFWEIHQARTGRAVQSALDYAHALFPITAGLRSFYRNLGVPIEHMHVLPDAVDPYDGLTDTSKLRESLGLPKEHHIIAYVGKYTTLEQSKGVEDIIASMALVVKSHLDAVFAIIGAEEQELPLIYNQAKAVGLPERNLLIILHVPHSIARAYMRAADVLIMNYPDTQHYRNYMSPMKLFEYMESGRPIVSSDLPSIREVLDDELAILVPAGNTAALANGIKQALNFPNESAKLAKRAHEKAKRYTWEARAGLIKTVYESLIPAIV